MPTLQHMSSVWFWWWVPAIAGGWSNSSYRHIIISIGAHVFVVDDGRRQLTHNRRTWIINQRRVYAQAAKVRLAAANLLYYIFMEHIKSMNIYLCLSGTFWRCLVARNCHRHFMSTYTRFAFHLHSRARGLPTQRLADKSSQQALSLSGTLPREFPVGMYTWYAWHHDWLSLSCSNECINSISDALTSRW